MPKKRTPVKLNRKQEARRNELVSANDGLVWRTYYSMRHHRALRGLDMEDVVQELRLCLLNDVQRFKPELGYKISTYLMSCLRGHALRLAGSGHVVSVPSNTQYNEGKKQLPRTAACVERAMRPVLSIGRQSKSEEDADKSLDPADQRRSGTEHVDVHDSIQQALRWLSPRERWVLEQHYLHGRTLTELAEEMGVTRSRTQQLNERALLKARLHISADAA